MFQIGDAVVHPIHGAGIVTDIAELKRRGHSEPYYRIELLNQPRTSVMISVGSAEERGMREAIAASRLERVWRVLNSSPRPLPTDHTVRHELLRDKLRGGDVHRVAEVLRDLVWRRRLKGHLTTVERSLYRKGVSLLAGEIAASRDIDLVDAKLRVWKRIRKSLTQHQGRSWGWLK